MPPKRKHTLSMSTPAKSSKKRLRSTHEEGGLSYDTVVAVSLPRRRNVLWPCRLCSEAEVLERISMKLSMDEGIDPSQNCLVVYLAEGAHHYFEWVSPSQVRDFDEGMVQKVLRPRAIDFKAGEIWAARLREIRDEHKLAPAAESPQSVATEEPQRDTPTSPLVLANSCGTGDPPIVKDRDSLGQGRDASLSSTATNSSSDAAARAAVGGLLMVATRPVPATLTPLPSPTPVAIPETPAEAMVGLAVSTTRSGVASLLQAAGEADGEIRLDRGGDAATADCGDFICEEGTDDVRTRSEAKFGGSVGTNSSSRKRSNSSSSNRLGQEKVHPLNKGAFAFSMEVLECPWRCVGCTAFTAGCHCAEGLPSFLSGNKRSAPAGRYARFDCDQGCSWCTSYDGLLIHMAEWGVRTQLAATTAHCRRRCRRRSPQTELYPTLMMGTRMGNGPYMESAAKVPDAGREKPMSWSAGMMVRGEFCTKAGVGDGISMGQKGGVVWPGLLLPSNAVRAEDSLALGGTIKRSLPPAPSDISVHPAQDFVSPGAGGEGQESDTEMVTHQQRSLLMDFPIFSLFQDLKVLQKAACERAQSLGLSLVGSGLDMFDSNHCTGDNSVRYCDFGRGLGFGGERGEENKEKLEGRREGVGEGVGSEGIFGFTHGDDGSRGWEGVKGGERGSKGLHSDGSMECMTLVMYLCLMPGLTREQGGVVGGDGRALEGIIGFERLSRQQILERMRVIVEAVDRSAEERSRVGKDRDGWARDNGDIVKSILNLLQDTHSCFERILQKDLTVEATAIASMVDTAISGLEAKRTEAAGQHMSLSASVSAALVGRNQCRTHVNEISRLKEEWGEKCGYDSELVRQMQVVINQESQKLCSLEEKLDDQHSSLQAAAAATSQLDQQLANTKVALASEARVAAAEGRLPSGVEAVPKKRGGGESEWGGTRGGGNGEGVDCGDGGGGRKSHRRGEKPCSALAQLWSMVSPLDLKQVAFEWDCLRGALMCALGRPRSLILVDALGICRAHGVAAGEWVQTSYEEGAGSQKKKLHAGLDRPDRLDLVVAVVDSIASSSIQGGRVVVCRRGCPVHLEFVRQQGLLELAHHPAYLAGLRARAAAVEEGYVEELTFLGCEEHEGDEENVVLGSCTEIEGDGEGAVEGAVREGVHGEGRGIGTLGSIESWEASLAAAGMVLEAVDAVFDGKAHNAFVATRPPGHHAGRGAPGNKGCPSSGMCLLNNAALGALYARHYKGAERVAVVDFDAQHGHGTEEILGGQPDRFLFVSLHAGDRLSPFVMPNEGSGDESGIRGNEGITGSEGGNRRNWSPGRGGGVLCLPLGSRVNAEGFHRAIAVAVDAVRLFRPDLLILSAGFTGRKGDPTDMGDLCANDFQVITNKMASVAEEVCGGRVVSVLEGGFEDESELGEAAPVVETPAESGWGKDTATSGRDAWSTDKAPGGATARAGARSATSTRGRLQQKTDLGTCLLRHVEALVSSVPD